MNATDFITESEYNDICGKIDRNEDFRHERTVVSGKNKYKYQVHNYWRNDYNAEKQVFEKSHYYVTSYIDYLYKDEKGTNQGGGTIDFLKDDWKGFKDILNKRLCNYPDYDEAEQITLF